MTWEMTQSRPPRPPGASYLPTDSAALASRCVNTDATLGSYPSARTQGRVLDPLDPAAARGWVARVRWSRGAAAGAHRSARARPECDFIACPTASERLSSVHICYVHVLEAFGTCF